MPYPALPGVIFPFFASIGLILLNEMGDKSQFLAMAFATRMRLRKVLLGIFLAVAVLNALAVAVGSMLASVPAWRSAVQLAAALLFLIFGVWTLGSREETDDLPKKRRGRYGDVAVVFTSFFFSEMGDKTQLATISLAASFPRAPLLVFAGTVAGMLLADGIGIFAGVILHRRLPGRALKFISAALFIVFGVVGVWQSLHDAFLLSVGLSAVVSAAAALLTATAGYLVYRRSAC